MNDTPTPRTDEFERATCCGNESSLNFARNLERELAAVKEKEIFYQLQVEQRDRFADYLKNTETELIAVTEQRDTLAQALIFVATDKIANAADMRYRAKYALQSLTPNQL